MAIVHWNEKYYAKMKKLGFNESELTPQVIDGRESELVREWRQLIIRYLDEWVTRIFEADKRDFTERDPETLERDANGYFKTRNLVDMWRMLTEQLNVAGSAERGGRHGGRCGRNDPGYSNQTAVMAEASR